MGNFNRPFIREQVMVTAYRHIDRDGIEVKIAYDADIHFGNVDIARLVFDIR